MTVATRARGHGCRKADADPQVLDKQTATDLGKDFGVVSPDRVVRVIHTSIMPWPTLAHAACGALDRADVRTFGDCASGDIIRYERPGDCGRPEARTRLPQPPDR